MFCPKCGAEMKEGAKFCHVCGLTLGDAPVNPQIQQTQAPMQSAASSTTSPFVKFLMFDSMITPWIIRILYWVGQVLIIVTGLVSMANVRGGGGYYSGYGGGGLFGGLSMGPLGGLLYIILGTLLLRLFFEILMVQFKICENTSQLKEIFKRKN